MLGKSYNNNKTLFVDKLLAQNLTVGNFTTSQIDSLIPQKGMILHDTLLNKLKHYDGTSWQIIETNTSIGGENLQDVYNNSTTGRIDITTSH